VKVVIAEKEEAELVNRYSKQLRRNILLLYCGNCKEHYEV